MVNWLTRGNWVVPIIFRKPKSGNDRPSTNIAPENQPFFSRKVVLGPYPSPGSPGFPCTVEVRVHA